MTSFKKILSTPPPSDSKPYPAMFTDLGEVSAEYHDRLNFYLTDSVRTEMNAFMVEIQKIIGRFRLHLTGSTLAYIEDPEKNRKPNDTDFCIFPEKSLVFQCQNIPGKPWAFFSADLPAVLGKWHIKSITEHWCLYVCEVYGKPIEVKIFSGSPGNVGAFVPLDSVEIDVKDYLVFKNNRPHYVNVSPYSKGEQDYLKDKQVVDCVRPLSLYGDQKSVDEDKLLRLILALISGKKIWNTVQERIIFLAHVVSFLTLNERSLYERLDFFIKKKLSEKLASSEGADLKLWAGLAEYVKLFLRFQHDINCLVFHHTGEGFECDRLIQAVYPECQNLSLPARDDDATNAFSHIKELMQLPNPTHYPTLWVSVLQSLALSLSPHYNDPVSFLQEAALCRDPNKPASTEEILSLFDRVYARVLDGPVSIRSGTIQAKKLFVPTINVIEDLILYLEDDGSGKWDKTKILQALNNPFIFEERNSLGLNQRQALAFLLKNVKDLKSYHIRWIFFLFQTPELRELLKPQYLKLTLADGESKHYEPFLEKVDGLLDPSFTLKADEYRKLFKAINVYAEQEDSDPEVRLHILHRLDRFPLNFDNVIPFTRFKLTPLSQLLQPDPNSPDGEPHFISLLKVLQSPEKVWELFIELVKFLEYQDPNGKIRPHIFRHLLSKTGCIQISPALFENEAIGNAFFWVVSGSSSWECLPIALPVYQGLWESSSKKQGGVRAQHYPLIRHILDDFLKNVQNPVSLEHTEALLPVLHFFQKQFAEWLKHPVLFEDIQAHINSMIEVVAHIEVKAEKQPADVKCLRLIVGFVSSFYEKRPPNSGVVSGLLIERVVQILKCIRSFLEPEVRLVHLENWEMLKDFSGLFGIFHDIHDHVIADAGHVVNPEDSILPQVETLIAEEACRLFVLKEERQIESAMLNICIKHSAVALSKFISRDLIAFIPDNTALTSNNFTPITRLFPSLEVDFRNVKIGSETVSFCFTLPDVFDAIPSFIKVESSSFKGVFYLEVSFPETPPPPYEAAMLVKNKPNSFLLVLGQRLKPQYLKNGFEIGGKVPRQNKLSLV